MDRYFMNTIPALAIMAGICIEKAKLKPIHWRIGGLVSVAFLAALFAINSLPIKYVPRFPSVYFQEIKSRNLQFLFSYTSSSGPTFGITFLALALSFILAIYFLGCYLLQHKKQREKSALLFALFLSFSVTFNVFLVTEYLFHPTGPDISGVKWTMIKYVPANKLSYPIYTNDEGIQWYFNHEYWKEKYTLEKSEVLRIPDNELDADTSFVKERIRQRGGTIVLLRWPPLPAGSPANEVTTLCTLHNQFSSKGIIIGEIYNC